MEIFHSYVKLPEGIGSFIHRLIGSGWDDSDILSIFFCITGSYLGWVFFFWSIGPCGLLAKLWKLVAIVFPAFFRSGFQCHVWATLVDQIEHHFPWLVVWNIFFFHWECHHPNWRSHSTSRSFSQGLDVNLAVRQWGKKKRHDVSASQLSHPEPFWVIWHFCALIALKNQSSCDQCGAHPILVPFLHVLVVLFSFSGLSIQAVHPSISVLISPFRLVESVESVESVEYLGFLLVFSAFSVDDHSPFRCLDRHVRPVRWVPTHWAALSVTSRAKPLVLLPVGEEVKDGSDETGHTCNMYVESMYMIYVSTTYMIYASM